jgi:hypothetical protein
VIERAIGGEEAPSRRAEAGSQGLDLGLDLGLDDDLDPNLTSTATMTSDPW